MSKFTARAREALRVVRRTFRKDQMRRRLRRTDQQLPLGSGEQWVWFEGTETVPSRRIPARSVGIEDPWQYQRRLQETVTERLQGVGVDHIAIPHFHGGPRRLGVRAADWPATLATVSTEPELGFAAPIGRPGRRIAEVELVPINQVVKFEDTACIAVLTPAVAHSPHGKKRYGFETAVIIEKWTETEAGELETPYWNPVISQLTPQEWTGQGSSADPAPFETPHLFESTLDIDLVYTWVDGTDEAWLTRKRSALESVGHQPLTEDAAADLRFIDHDELRYSLRSIEQYAPWVRHIWIVTDQQHPEWLRRDHPRVTVVDHRDIAPPDAVLPTFNSHAIEANLHRIEGLSEHFLYFNDDVFLSSPVSPDLFFSANGISHMFLSRARVATGEPISSEPASDTAGKNARALVAESVGRRVSRKLFHAPFALNRAVSQEIESQWPDAVAQTRAAQFRTIKDVTVAGALHMNYAFATGRAVTRGVRYRYVNIGAFDSADRLERLYRDRFRLQTFCLNEATEELPAAVIDSQVREFLARRYPDISSFEIAE